MLRQALGKELEVFVVSPLPTLTRQETGATITPEENYCLLLRGIFTHSFAISAYWPSSLS